MKRIVIKNIFAVVFVFCLTVLYGCGGGGGETSNEPSVTAQELRNKSFILASGEVFNASLKDQQTTITFGSFTGNSGNFALVSQKGTAMGKVTLGSCTFVITLSTFPINQGPQTGDTVITKPCNMSDDKLELLMTNTETGLTAEAVLQLLSDPADYNSIAAMFTGDPSYGALAIHENGEKIVAMTESDTQGHIIKITGGIWISPKGENIIIYLGDNGLPRRINFNNEAIVLFS